ncbi:hypothetical protein JAAARDRAFT_31222 [Jaapia argillacea MUCL 33604]|uniref:Cryptic loci regulator 2 N-terminal domain-containing protein n=1 Tax=Jaapia argillacea MUCL 33604 TaxID=933084 RepID=A0A067Q6E5_9AGAM|nr:hypothetical protein JAAARDRAFT_31222 [Jaapia argillacea MUCL 33604]
MPPRTLGGAHVLPDNPVWIEIPRSDGDPSRWPNNTSRVVDNENHVNFMRPCPIDEGSCIGWRRNIGEHLAKLLGMPEGPAYVLKDWPTGYQFYDHNKGHMDNPRHDPYLIGSIHVNRFRSTPEFAPHAYWLIRDETMDRSNCGCKYCAKKTQRDVSDTMGLSQRRSSSVATSNNATSPARPRPSKTRPKRQPQPREQSTRTYQPYAAVRRQPRPPKPKAAPKYPMSKERASDLRAAFSSAGFEIKRLFRMGEILWCALERPIEGPKEESSIRFWPGIVEDVTLKSETTPPTLDESLAGRSHDGAPSWTVRQWTVYKMKLIGVAFTCFLPDTRVLPYQAHAPSTTLIEALNRHPVEQMDISPEQISGFNPWCAQGSDTAVGTSTGAKTGARFEDAVAPFSLALQIAASLAGFWTPTDEWEFKMTMSPPEQSTSSAPQKDSSFTTNLADAISTSMARNGAATGANAAMSRELAGLTTSILGRTPENGTQIRYQGLWWGAERIWTDELVRLKLARRQIAPGGAPNIYPPAGPSLSAMTSRDLGLGSSPIEGLENDGMDLDADFDADAEHSKEGAGGRGVFMRLDGVFIVEIPREDGGVKRETRACGVLYELVDEDWEEDQNVRSKGKGKERQIDDFDSIPISQAGTINPSLLMTQSKESGPAFLPGPSPLKPKPLPNPDPSVAVADTASSMMAETLSSTSVVRQPSSNDQLSHPLLTTTFPLPDPPRGFKFRPILAPGHEVVVSISLISGRYYPNLLFHPLLREEITRSLSDERGSLEDSNHLWSLDGLLPGFLNCVDPTRWKTNRQAMLRDADGEARSGLFDHWQRKLAEAQSMIAMEM